MFQRLSREDLDLVDYCHRTIFPVRDESMTKPKWLKSVDRGGEFVQSLFDSAKGKIPDLTFTCKLKHIVLYVVLLSNFMLHTYIVAEARTLLNDILKCDYFDQLPRSAMRSDIRKYTVVLFSTK